MCWILHLPGGAGTDEATIMAIEADIRRAAELNNEGYGVAAVVPSRRLGRRLAAARSMDLETALHAYALIGGTWPDAPITFHARLATTGVVSMKECHPIMTPDGRYAVFLNGTLPAPWSSDPAKNDTQEFAATLQEMVRWRDDLREAGDLTILTPMLGTLIGKRNRMIIMTDDMAQPEPVHVINRDQWTVTPYGGLASQPDHLGPGIGWDEKTEDGHLYRWNILQPGQCPGCHLYGCERGCAPRPFDPPRWRDETKRIAERRAS